MGISEVIRDKRESILQLAKRHGVRRIQIFGSVARGEAGSGSDVDFLVEAGPTHSPFFPGELVLDLEDLLGRKVDVIEPEGIYPPLRESVLREAIPL